MIVYELSVRVPANFGRELINSPVHGNLELNLKDGSQLRVNSVIMSLNSPVIGNFTTNLCQVMRSRETDIKIWISLRNKVIE